MQFRVDDVTDPRVVDFLAQHIQDMLSVSPPESKHALDIDGLRQSDITFWTAWQDDLLVGCGALKELDPTHGEIKSMRTNAESRSKGVGSQILSHLMKVAKLRGYNRLSLETGSMPFFEPARKLYRKFGFSHCDPFAEYRLDPNSVYMTIELANNYRGKCTCGAVRIVLSMPQAIENYCSRACDCDFCTRRHIEYISHPDGAVLIEANYALETIKQGSDQAEFLACSECDDVITASYPEPRRIGSLNATLLADYPALQGAEVVSPKLLNADDKLARWRKLWMPIDVMGE